MSTKLAWGIIGAGNIANVFAGELATSRTGKLVAIGSRSQESAERFGEKWQVPHRYSSYEQVLSDPEVQAVYIAIPHPFHAEWAIKAAEAGKHILCEKPIGLNHAEATAIIAAARRNNVFLMEAFMYRFHPQIAKTLELIRSGTIGQVRVIEATFSYHANFSPEQWYLGHALAGGAIIDVGGYCTTAACLIAEAATGQTITEPLSVKASGHISEISGTDEYSQALLTFPEAILAYVATGTQVDLENSIRIFGSKGWLKVPDPWTPPAGEATRLILKLRGEKEERVLNIESTLGNYAAEADALATHLEERQVPSPGMTWAATLGNMRTLDQWRNAIGLVYEQEKPTGPGQNLTISKRPLAKRAEAPMTYGHISGVAKPISRLVMGVDNQITWPRASVMFDDFFEQGGTCFDTAHCYGLDGACEKQLGQWVKHRNVREQVVIMDKGAEIPYCTPDWLTRHHLESLERLEMDYVDIYLIHRDNPEVPVGEFISVFNEHKRKGTMRIFGVSNWSLERVQEANRWAAEHNLEGISVLSNNFSLARMVEPPWEDCYSSSDAQWRAWLQETQLPLMPWSSQARGFFAGNTRSGYIPDEELVRVWHCEDNFQRLERAKDLARQRGVLPINIALAYVLNQPFPTFPLIGPRQPSETWSSLSALTIHLTPAELRWLNLE